MRKFVAFTTLFLIVHNVDSLTVNARYESPNKCNAGLKDVIFAGKPYTLYCEYGLAYTDVNLESVVIGKGVDTLFDFQGDEAYIKGDIQGRSKDEWTADGVKIKVFTANIDTDKAEYKCSVVRYDPDEDEESTFELNRIYNQPTQKEMNALLITDTEKDIKLNPGFGEHIITATAKIYPNINCSLPTVTWSGDLDQPCRGMDGDKEVKCELTIKEKELSKGKVNFYDVNSEQYGVKSEMVRFTVQFAGDSALPWWVIPVIVVLIVVAIIGLVIGVLWLLRPRICVQLRLKDQNKRGVEFCARCPSLIKITWYQNDSVWGNEVNVVENKKTTTTTIEISPKENNKYKCVLCLKGCCCLPFFSVTILTKGPEEDPLVGRVEGEARV